MFELVYIEDPKIPLDRIDEVADAIGCLGIGFFGRMPNQKEYKASFTKGRRECIRSGYDKVPFVCLPNPIECAYLDGWKHELEQKRITHE